MREKETTEKTEAANRGMPPPESLNRPLVDPDPIKLKCALAHTIGSFHSWDEDEFCIGLQFKCLMLIAKIGGGEEGPEVRLASVTGIVYT